MPMIAKAGIWMAASLLYACECAPVYFRLLNHSKNDVIMVIGMIMMISGLVVESVADYQKNKEKSVNPHRFVDNGLYKIVRCPNYIGEMLFWTGVLVTGFLSMHGIFQWLLSLLGFAGIIFVMFSGARRLEMRQNRTYGHDSEYQTYVKTTPIMLPFVPLYSVEKYKWLVA